MTETNMSSKDTAETLRKKLKIPDEETSKENIGYPESIRKEMEDSQLQTEESAKDDKKDGGFLGRLFGKKK